MGLSRQIVAGIAAAGALACAPAAAQAATVNVEETHPPEEIGFSTAIVHFAAAPGETNVVSISRAEPEPGPGTEPPATTTVIVRDTGAPLTPGIGCSAIDAHTATCAVHGWHPQASEYCGHDCYNQIPGTAWQDAERIELGDGNDAFESSMGGTYERSWSIEVDGGSGADSITTGSGTDEITPGPGDDQVDPGEGDNRVIADPQPDGNDTLDLPDRSKNELDYAGRSEPLHLANRVIGAAGERDTITAAGSAIDEIVAGSGDDDLHGEGESLRGGRGDDTLTGSPGKDIIGGGRGKDTIRGEAGDDRLFGGSGEDLIEAGAGQDIVSAGAGDDTVEGGAGDDKIEGEGGSDTARGGSGDDELDGGPGNDTLDGGSGNDLLTGDEGKDVLRGGKGDDLLRSSYNDQRYVPGSGVDSAADSLDGGPGHDVAQVNPWDQIRNCEKREMVRAVRFREVGDDRAKGRATVSFVVYAAGGATLTVGGDGVAPVTQTWPQAGRSKVAGEFVVRAQGAALQKLRATGRVTLRVDLTWHPFRQPAAIETRRLTLLLKRR